MFHCLQCRGTNPACLAIYLINNMYDPVCGCDVASHDVSALDSEVLKGEERRGFALALWELQLPGVLCCGFPHLSKHWPGAPPQPCLVPDQARGQVALRKTSTKEVMWGLCAAPHVQDSKAMG